MNVLDLRRKKITPKPHWLISVMIAAGQTLLLGGTTYTVLILMYALS